MKRATECAKVGLFKGLLASLLLGGVVLRASAGESILAPTTQPTSPLAAAISSPVVIGSGGVALPTVKSAISGRPLRVLFIGNSYTFFNGGMGSLVQSLAASVKGGRKFEFTEVTKGGQTLEGHWKEGKALTEIRKGNWDYIVLQEHSQRPLLEREKMWQYAKAFDAEIKKVGAKTVFYETWARKNKPETQSGLDQAYVGIAHEVAAVVAPAGLAWDKVLHAKPDMSLHIADLSHPTPAGSYLNACVFYETFFGKTASGLPRTLRNAAGKVLVELSEADATLLQHAANDTCGLKKPE